MGIKLWACVHCDPIRPGFASRVVHLIPKRATPFRDMRSHRAPITRPKNGHRGGRNGRHRCRIPLWRRCVAVATGSGGCLCRRFGPGRAYQSRRVVQCVARGGGLLALSGVRLRGGL